MTESVALGLATGLTAGALLTLGARLPALAWAALVAVAAAITLGSPLEAALAGSLTGAIASTRTVASPPLRPLVPLTMVTSFAPWAVGCGASAWLIPPDQPAWVAVALPATAVLGALPLRLFGAPRWVSNPIACTQQRCLTMVHVGRFGGDPVVTTVVALGGAGLWLLSQRSWTVGLSAVGVVAAAWTCGAARRRAAMRRLARTRTLRVAAVVADPDGSAEVTGPVAGGTRDVAGTIARYAPLVAQAAERGARLVVLPEVAVFVDDTTRGAWLTAAARWARERDIVVVAPYLDTSAQRNRLAVVASDGVRATYDKQHSARGLEPPRIERTPVGPHDVLKAEAVNLSTVICADLDYPDHVAILRALGGVLAVPANDWFAGGFAALHHDAAVWTPARSGVAMIRATGHGISSIVDGAGRILAQRSSADGPVVLVADVPHERRHALAGASRCHAPPQPPRDHEGLARGG